MYLPLEVLPSGIRLIISLAFSRLLASNYEKHYLLQYLEDKTMRYYLSFENDL